MRLGKQSTYKKLFDMIFIISRYRMRNFGVLVLIFIAHGCSDAFLFDKGEFEVFAELNRLGMLQNVNDMYPFYFLSGTTG